MDLSAEEYATRDRARLDALVTGPPITWVFAGDSITQAVVHTHGERGYVEHVCEVVRHGAGRAGDAVVNSGVSGWTAADLLPEFHWRIGRFAPDVVFLMFGTNDCRSGADAVREFRYNLDQILGRSRDTGAVVVLQTPPAVLVAQDEGGLHAAFDDYVDAVRALAADRGAMLVDHAAQWAQQGPDVLAARMDDPIHPGPEGHRALARTVLDGIGMARA